MNIRSLRLKNIKSYGEGPDGNGVTVDFQAGVNRIAGRNGHGKTSLIESLGYALFLSEPKFEENFKLERYLLRHGAKAGEIDVTFEHAGTIYRVERGLGSTNKRRSKVVDCTDESICAEGDAEVAKFLCDTLNMPHPEQLAEVFSKLIGVKQGRMTWPFDSKAAEAKRFFEPLFDVAVFRACFDRLKPTVDAFQSQGVEHQRALAVENEKITDRAESRQQLTDAQRAVSELEKSRTGAVEAREVSRKLKDQHEAKEKTLIAAQTTQEKAAVTLRGATVRRTDGEAQVKEAEVAAATLRETEPAHQAFQKAEAALVELERQREQRDAQQRLRDAAESARKDHAAKAVAARDQAQTFAQQCKEKETQAKALTARVEPLRTKLASSKRAFDQAQQSAAISSQDRALVQAWVKGLSRAVTKLGGLATEIATNAKELAMWDTTVLVTATNAEQVANANLKSAEGDLAKARGLRSSLQQQLSDISGGMCPFLKEACRQFDPSKVQSDLDAQASVILALEQTAVAAAAAHTSAKRQLQALEAAETRLVAKREQQARDIAQYLADARSLVAADAADAYDRLRKWEPKLVNAATVLSVPSGAVGADEVTLLQADLGQFQGTVAALWTDDDAAITIHLTVHEQEKTARQSEQNSLDHLSGQLTAVQKESTNLAKSAETKVGSATLLDAEAAKQAHQVEGFDAKLKVFTGLNGQITAQREQRDANRASHGLYLQAKGLADDLTPRQQRLLERTAEEKIAATANDTTAAILKAASADFDDTKLASARTDFQQKHDAVTALDTNLKHARAALVPAQKRVDEWGAACAERDRIALELGRLEAAIDLTELARRVLQKAAPAVAQHLCDRIATRAQVLFNQINPDPIQLAWDAERYTLTVEPGDRRFAMLSGGEQTKLALALTLAMIEEFGGLRFCIFDEPTYGVDAESRQKLADAILSVQEAAGLDQLLLVSHDDAFEGKTEHTILLTKSAASGSAVASAA